ncbi:M56 family metallopeptidase, partial [candidate division KSB1 bacterium]
MDLFFNYISHFQNTAWIEIILDMMVKGTFLLCAAFGAVFMWRRARASVRHFYWSVVLSGIILLPLLSVVLPAWEMNIFTLDVPQEMHTSETAGAIPPEYEQNGVPGQETIYLNMLTDTEKSLNNRSGSQGFGQYLANYREYFSQVYTILSDTVNRLHWAVWLLLIWLSGALIILVRFLVNLIGPRLMIMRAVPVKDRDFCALAAESARKLGVTRNVRLLESKWIAVPLAWGWFRPAVVLPEEAGSWPENLKEAVLLHELAHIKRGDFLSTVIANFASVIYWFNPMIWISLRQLYKECESACDELVLSTGAKPAEYAENLLEIARALNIKTWSSPLGLAMARKIHLEERVMAILRKKHTASINPFARISICIVAVSLLVPLACLNPWAKKEKPDEQEVVTVQEQEKIRRLVRNPEDRGITLIRSDQKKVEQVRQDSLRNVQIMQQVLQDSLQRALRIQLVLQDSLLRRIKNVREAVSVEQALRVAQQVRLHQRVDSLRVRPVRVP